MGTCAREREFFNWMQADDSFSVDGLMTANAFTQRFGGSFDYSPSKTFAGYVFTEPGHNPKIGESGSLGE